MSEGRRSTDVFSDEGNPVRDTRSLKAFTHPLRMQILEYLSDHEEATSTILAKHLGESTGQTSYHLRQLEKHGFVKELKGRGTGRERWWQSKGYSVAPEDVQSLARQSPLLGTLLERHSADRAHKLAEYQHRLGEEDPQWVDASAMSTMAWAPTAEEMKSLRDELWAVADRHLTAAKQRGAVEPESRRRARIHLDMFALPPEAPTEE